MAHREYIVIGLGRFGGGLAETLVGMGHEVLGVDADPKNVQEFAGTLTHVVEADSTDERAMAQIGAGEFETAIVAIGTEIEASILTTAVLADLGVRRIVAKAVTQAHGRILERVGAHRVVFPERDMGVRVGHSLAGSILDYFELDPVAYAPALGEAADVLEGTRPVFSIDKAAERIGWRPERDWRGELAAASAVPTESRAS